jgi:hypothetical protein
MQIATEHAETVGESAGMRVEERLLLDGIALRSGDVSPGHVERSAAVITNLANAGLAVGDGATVSARKTADAILVELLVEKRVSFADSIIENIAKGGHGFLASILTLMREDTSGFRLQAARQKGWTLHAHSAASCSTRS